MSYHFVGDRVARVRERIAAACARAGRAEDAVRLVAVTKTHPSAAVLAAREAGVLDVGENRVQELEEKVGEVGRDAVRWHLIGHLQRNKARRAVALADLIHSLDSERLARKLSDEAQEAGTVVRVLAQVNVAGEETKGGWEGDRLVDALGTICALPALRVEGLMTMAPYTDDEALLRRTFARVRELAVEATRQVPAFEPVHLSMGMSNDFELAVEEGSTLVRLGTVLFGERDYQ